MVLRKQLQMRQTPSARKRLKEYTSQTCPKCGHIERANRNKKTRSFECRTCHYRSNDDRIGAMNLYRKDLSHELLTSN